MVVIAAMAVLTVSIFLAVALGLAVRMLLIHGVLRI